MAKRKYRQMSTIETEIDAMLAEGKSHKEIEAHFGLIGDRPIHNFLKRRRRKDKKILAGVPSRAKGRPPKGYIKTEAEKDYEIKRLKMENELLRDFLRLAGRR
jgi:hypothetical protein